MTEACEKYLEDPEGNAAHLDACSSCAALAGELGASIDDKHGHRRLQLPLAPWEGASHRAWPLVIAGAAATLFVAMALFLAAGVSPLIGIVRAITDSLPSIEVFGRVFRLAGGALQSAPAKWQIALGVSFVVVNTLLVLLLRRAPRGIDV